MFHPSGADQAVSFLKIFKKQAKYLLNVSKQMFD